MLLLFTSIKLVTEIALMAMIGQWLVDVLAGVRREENVFYQLLKLLTDPFVRGTRLITPRVVWDQHVPLVAFLLLAIAWAVATVAKIRLCFEIGLQACR